MCSRGEGRAYMRHGTIVWLTTCSLVLAAPAARAADDDVDLDSSRTRLSVRSVGYYTDNAYNSPDSCAAPCTSGKTAAIGAVVTPELKLIAQTRKVNFSSLLIAEYGAFDLPGSQDDYLDGTLDLRLVVQATVRNQLRLGGGFKAGHDPFGVDRTEDATFRDLELDLWNQTSGSMHYRYGAAGAKINAEVGVSAYTKEYTSNRADTEVLDYKATTLDYAVFYNYSPKTAALVDFSRTDYSFDQFFAGVDTRGGELYRARAGMRWLATAKTSGDVRVGYRRRVFDQGAADIEGADWEAGIDWAPVPRSTVRLATAHSEQQSYTAGARVIDIESVSLAWTHNLTARTRSRVMLERLSAGFEGSTRDDEILAAQGTLEYLALSYLWLVGNVGMTTRDSTVADREYDRLNAFVGVRLGR